MDGCLQQATDHLTTLPSKRGSPPWPPSATPPSTLCATAEHDAVTATRTQGWPPAG
ncbi:hypothetical protein ACFPK5_36120 [Streptomyces beijiangensis]|uniref:hypothetical protein n=1 Tax=Streptomyces beijiangensis TaxID=163361 RepID=UPI00360D8DAB